jgi:glycosyltransferase involved in cell wall biosynthesis
MVARLRSDAAALHKADDRKLRPSLGVDTGHFYPIPPDDTVPGLKPENRIVLFVGRIEPLKGVDTLLRHGLREDEGPASPHLAIIGASRMSARRRCQANDAPAAALG